ncbi:tyrosine-type recombinase/integrase [Gloeobacter kilaueensis]|uniref:tyrosine-type recombinase/integrase n=1 Tax=Gloeobacter kilaueensis TaxID=1416614 RepID=UPI001CB6E28F|nr:tyrosine-type recombinase/integrase [Gloeobacter kilaueensis]
MVIEAVEGRLRLRWQAGGKRYAMALGLPDGVVNRKMAQVKAGQIEGDIATGNFDATLSKYRAPTATGTAKRTKIVLAVELFDRFTAYKAKFLDPRTIENYLAIRSLLVRFFGEKPAADIDQASAENFAQWLVEQAGVAPRTAREKLWLIKSAWKWAMEPIRGIVQVNVWAELPGRVKVPPKQRPRPFSKEEMARIVEGFTASSYYAHYTDYVRFLLATGVRTGEAVGLQWKHVAADCSWAWIGESVSKGVRKATKTGKARVLPMTAALQAILLLRKGAGVEPEALVFPAPGGGPIDANNFHRRAWMTVLGSLGIDPRRPYNCRHSLVSNALDMGMSPLDVAALTGHNVRTLYTFYAANVNSRPRLPEL